MRTSISSLLFSIGSSLKVSMRVNTRVENEPNTTDILTVSTWSLNEYIRITLNPYLEFDFRNKYDYKQGVNKQLKTIAISRKDVFILIHKLKRLLKNMCSNNGLFYYDKEQNLKLNIEKSEEFKISHVTVYNDMMEFKPFLVTPTDNSFYEGIIIILRNDLSVYSYMSTEDLSYFIYELEKINFSILAHELFNTYIAISGKTNNQSIKNNTQPQQNLPKVQINSAESISTNLKYNNTIPEV